MPTRHDAFIPANVFWDISMRFLSWECWDFWRRHDHFRRFPKKSEVFWRRPTPADGEVIEKMLIHKIRVLPFIYFTHDFNSLHGSELTYFWKLCQEKWQQLTFFNQAWEIGLQAWAGVRSKFSTRRRESWQVYAFQNTVRGKIYRYDLRSLPCLAVFVFFFQIHLCSGLYMDDTLALWVYGLGKHKASSSLDLSWHQVSLPDFAIKRIQKRTARIDFIWHSISSMLSNVQ